MRWWRGRRPRPPRSPRRPSRSSPARAGCSRASRPCSHPWAPTRSSACAPSWPAQWPTSSACATSSARWRASSTPSRHRSRERQARRLGRRRLAARERRLPGRGRGQQAGHVERRQRRRGHARQAAPPLGEEAPCPAPVPVREMMIGDRDLDHALERLPLRAGRRLPHRLEHLVHLEEEPLVPERGGDPAGAHDAGAGRAAPKGGGGSQRAPRVRGHRRRVRRMHGEERAPARIDQMHGREARRGCGQWRVGGRGEPAERRGSRVVLAGGEPQLRERVAQRERKPGRGHARISPVLEALTDWVYVDVESGRPRRVPRELETAFGFAAGNRSEREAWSAPPAPPAPALGTHRVRACEVDSIGHVNNAVYLEVATQAVLDAIEDAGWSLDRMLAAGSVPLLARADLEYLEGARYGDRLAIATWFAWAPAALDAHQQIARASGERPLVRVSTRWRWVAAAGGEPLAAPDGVRAALGPLLAA